MGSVEGVRGFASADSGNWVTAPHNRVGFIRVSELTRTEPVSRGEGPVVALPQGERNLETFRFAFEGRVIALPTLLEETFTDALVVVHDGAVVFERYPAAMQRDDAHLLMSVSKSISAVLCGIYVSRGLLDPADRVVDHVAALRDTSWEGCTIQHLLDMRTGTEWVYERDEIDLLDVSGYRATARSDLPTDTARWIRTIPKAREHGGSFRYVSLANDVLGWVLEEAGGDRLPALLSRDLWSAIGAERDADLIVDASGFAVIEGGLCATARDLARFGLLCLGKGGVGGREVVPAGWLDRLRRVDRELVAAYAAAPEFDAGSPDAFYHDHWWIEDAERGVYAGLGIYGQRLLIHHPSRSVVVKLSSQPDPEDPRLGALERAGLMALCESLA